MTVKTKTRNVLGVCVSLCEIDDVMPACHVTGLFSLVMYRGLSKVGEYVYIANHQSCELDMSYVLGTPYSKSLLFFLFQKRLTKQGNVDVDVM